MFDVCSSKRTCSVESMVTSTHTFDSDRGREPFRSSRKRSHAKCLGERLDPAVRWEKMGAGVAGPLAPGIVVRSASHWERMQAQGGREPSARGARHALLILSLTRRALFCSSGSTPGNSCGQFCCGVVARCQSLRISQRIQLLPNRRQCYLY